MNGTPLDELIVGDKFWLKRAQHMVLATIRARDQAAHRLMSTIGWFWTVYTAAALVGVNASSKVLPVWATVFLALPAVTLIVAYVVAAWTTMPVTFGFDPRVPTGIEKAHEFAVERKKRRLTFAWSLTVASSVCVASAIVGTAFAFSDVDDALEADVISLPDGSRLSFRGAFRKAKTVGITVTPVLPATAPAPVQVSQAYPVLRGRVIVNTRVQEAPSYRIAVAWREMDVERTATLTVKSSATEAH